MEMPEGWERMHTVEILVKDDFILITEAIGLMKEMAKALDQYRGISGRDSNNDREGSRYSVADEILRKFNEWK